MIRTPLGAIAALAIAAIVGAVPLLAQPDGVEAQSHSATRTFQQDWAAPGSELRITITASDYGPIGQVVETLPEGFTFVSASLEDAHFEVDGQTIRFNLLGETSFSYNVTVPAVDGEYIFSGVIKDIDLEERAVGGHTTLRVGSPPTPTPTHTPAPTSTPTPVPTATATPEPTATPTPQPTPSPTPESTTMATLTPTPEPTTVLEPTPTALSPSTEQPSGNGGAPVVLILLVVAAAVVVIGGSVAYVRRRRK